LSDPSALWTAGRRLCARRGSEFVGGLLTSYFSRCRPKATKKTWALASSLHSPAGVCELLYQFVASICCILFLLAFADCLSSHGAWILYETCFALSRRFGRFNWGNFAGVFRAWFRLFVQFRFPWALCNYTDLVPACQTSSPRLWGNL
jgi:hypothetical protein